MFFFSILICHFYLGFEGFFRSCRFLYFGEERFFRVVFFFNLCLYFSDVCLLVMIIDLCLFFF
ncbi:hypothetical protein HanRHA438_Chr12g0551151 [Helianthus annuus]|nr:hypothetical protein HanRHA438_Chr12g0551151 [Helianthus annuus]